jgi:MinD-like ATPase involved in chromosome partitioning or flagellar assembly
VLLALWSPKGGSGTSVVTAACALVLARHGGVRLADLAGDQPAIFGLATDPTPGLLDWLAAGTDAPLDALDRLTVTATPEVTLLPCGERASQLAPVAAAEAGAALAVLLRDGPVPTIVDAGTAEQPATRAVVEVSDVSVIVLRGCYLALRRAVHSPLTPRAAGAVLVEENARSLGPNEIRDVIDRPVLTRIPIKSQVARAVDAGVLAARLPDQLGRPVTRMLARLGLVADRRGAVA